MSAPRITVRLLGPVDIRVDGQPLAVDTRKAVALLAYLALTARPASREAIAALLWPEADDRDARGALRRTLSVLNAGLGGPGLRIDRGSVGLLEGAVEVDVHGLRAALERARRHGHDPDAACGGCDESLDAAIALDRGPFMDGFGLRDSEPFDEWQTAEAETSRRDVAAALERVARSRFAAGDWDGALSAGRRWLELDPLHEPAHRLLMATHAAAGESAAAIRQYRDCVRILDVELGVPPLDATSEMYEAIRAGAFPPSTISRPTPATSSAAAPVAVAGRGSIDGGDGPLVGRSAELDQLLSTIRSVGPDGRLLIVEGEPGIGKTRLVGAVADRLAQDGAAVLAARAYAGEATIPYAAIAELIRAGLERPGAGGRLTGLAADRLAEAARLVPIPGVRPRVVAPADPLGRGRLLEALVELLIALAAGPMPGLIWLDDAQWADASSLDVIAFLARRLHGRPVALLLSRRREDLIDPAADGVIGQPALDAGPGGASNVADLMTLGRLDRESVAALARAALGTGATRAFVDTLFAASEGLPLYVVEAFAEAAGRPDPRPGGIDAMIRSRLASTSEVARQVASAAAVIGRSFELETVRLASGRSEDEAVAAIEELSRRGFVREAAPADRGSIRYDFTHDRLRAVVYDDLGLARRRLLHRRVAEALAAPGEGRDGGARWSTIANHERLAGRSAEAAEAYRRAGDYARSVHAIAEARGHFEAALALGHPATGALHESLGDILTLLGDYRGAIGQLEAAAATADPHRLAVIELQLGRVHARRGAWDRAEAHLEAALASAPPPAPAIRSAILADRSAVELQRGDPAAAEATARGALTIATEATDAAAVARAEQVLGMLARRRGDLTAARTSLERALAGADPVLDPGLRIAALNTLALVAADAGQPADAIALAEEALGLCERIGDRHRQAAIENNLADLFRAAGRRDEAMEHLKRAVVIFVEVGGTPGEYEPEIWKLVEW